MTRMNNSIAKGLGAILGGALLITACAKPDPYAVVSCPYIGVLDDAAEVTRFKFGGGRDVSDIEIHGEVTKVDYTCYQPENKKYVVARAEIHTKFERGMSASMDQHAFKVFMVISEREERIVKKENLTVKVKFGDKDKVVTRKTVIKKIRVATDGAVSPELHNIYFGFQLSPVEVAYNRTKKQS